MRSSTSPQSLLLAGLLLMLFGLLLLLNFAANADPGSDLRLSASLPQTIVAGRPR